MSPKIFTKISGCIVCGAGGGFLGAAIGGNTGMIVGALVGIFVGIIS